MQSPKSTCITGAERENEDCTPYTDVTPNLEHYDASTTPNTNDSSIDGETLNVKDGKDNGEQPVDGDDVPAVPFYKAPLFWVAVIVMIVVGGGNPLIAKMSYMQSSYPCSPNDQCEPKMFDGYMGFTVSKYVWQSMWGALLFYLLDKRVLKNPIFSDSVEMRNSLKSLPKRDVISCFLFTSALDVAFTVCERSATSYTRASVIAVISSFQMVVAALGDMVLFNRAMMVGEVIGFSIIMCGLALYGWSSLLASKAADDNDRQDIRPVLGACLALACAFCRGLHSSFQGFYMKKFKIPPLKWLMFESLVGVVYATIVTIVLHCVGAINSTDEFWMAVRNPAIMGYMQLFGALCIGLNGGAAVIGKYVASLFRMILLRFNGLLSWVLEIGFGWLDYSNLTLIGWVLIIFGAFVFAGMLPVFKRVFYRPILVWGLSAPDKSMLSQGQVKRMKMNMIMAHPEYTAT